TFFYKLAGNGSGLCVRAGFRAQNCQPAQNLNRSTKLQVCTSPRLTQNPCYLLAFLSFSSFQAYKFTCKFFCKFSTYVNGNSLLIPPCFVCPIVRTVNNSP